MKTLLMAIIATFMLFSATCQEEETTPYYCILTGPEELAYDESGVYNVTVYDLPAGVSITEYVWDVPNGLSGSSSSAVITITNNTLGFSGSLCVDVHLSNGEYVRCCITIDCPTPCCQPSSCQPTLQGVHHCLTSSACGGSKSGVLHVDFDNDDIADACWDLISEICVSVSEGYFPGTGSGLHCYDLANGDLLPIPNHEFLFCSTTPFGQDFDAAVNITYTDGTVDHVTAVVDGGCN